MLKMKPYEKFKTLYNSSQEFFDDIMEYVESCMYYKYEKIRVDGNDEFEIMQNIRNSDIKLFYKLPTVSGFCLAKGILRETFYAQKQRGEDYRQIANFFTDVIIKGAAEECLLDKSTYSGASFMLKLKDYLEDRRQKQEEDKLKLEKEKLAIDAARINTKLIEAKINQMSSGQIEDPYISTFLQDLSDIVKSSDTDNKTE